MQALIGPTTSAPTIAVGAEAVNDNLFMLTPSGSAVDCTNTANAYRVCFSDPAQGAKSAQYIGENKLATKVAILYDSSDVYSSGIYESFASEAQNYGIEIVDTEQFTADSKTDFSTQLQKMQASGAELAFLPFYYTEAFGGTPIQFAADAYDAVYIIKAAAEAGNLTPDMSVDAIGAGLEEQMKTLTYDGITGAGMTWDEKGDVDKEPKAVVIKDGAYVSAE